MEINKQVEKQIVKYIVQRNIFCPLSGDVLDVRTCKWLVDKDGVPAYVMSPEAYDSVYRGREAIETSLNARGCYFPEND